MNEPILVFTVTPDEPKAPPPPPAIDKATVADVISWFVVADPYESRSVMAKTEMTRVRELFAAEYGHLSCEEAKPYHIVEFISRRPGIKSSWSRRRWATTITRPFNYAARLGFVHRNPFAGVTYVKGNGGRDWTDEEFQTMMRVSPPELRILILWIYYSGMRPGEARQLQWDDVDLEEQCVALDGSRTKSGRTRRIPLNAVMLKILIWLKKRISVRARIPMWSKKQVTTTHVFRNSQGGQWQTRAMTKALRTVRKRAGLSDAVKLHGGRHKFATRALVNGVDIMTLSTLLGHKHIATTAIYLHLSDKTQHLQSSMEKAVGQKGETSSAADEERGTIGKLKKAAAEMMAGLDVFLGGERKEGAA